MYCTGEKAPCPCIIDGVMLATNASPGQRNACHRVGESADGTTCRCHRAQSKKRRRLPLYRRRYVVAEGYRVEQDVRSRRFDAAMKAEGLFDVAPAPAQ
jgi:hypothetical protein